MITDRETIDLFFIDYDWVTVFQVGVNGDGNGLQKPLNEIDSNNPTHIKIEYVQDIKAILAFAEPEKPNAPYLLLFQTQDNNYGFFSVAMVEVVEDFGDKQQSRTQYHFTSLVGKKMSELWGVINKDAQKEFSLDDENHTYLKSIIEQEELESKIEPAKNATKIKL